jgi:hypothetical protein
MRMHLSEEQMIDLFDGVAPAEARAHAESCAECGKGLSALRSAFELAREADVPEPSPLYWQALRRNVQGRIAAPRRFVWGLGWRPLAAAAAVALAALSVVPGAGTPPSARRAAATPAWSPLPAEAQDAGLSVIKSAIESEQGDLGTLGQCPNYVNCIETLSESERQSVAAALREELGGRKS